MRSLIIPFYCFCILSFIGCEYDRLNFDKAIISQTPQNLSDVNSKYDDYNSNIGRIYSKEEFKLTFSTNSLCGGLNFDFITYDCRFKVDLVKSKMGIWAVRSGDSLIEVINSSYDEFGPLSMATNNSSPDNRFFYSNNSSGNMDIKMFYYCINDGQRIPGDSATLTGINSSFNDGYITFHDGTDLNREEVYFSSDRSGNYDLFRATGELNKRIETSDSIMLQRVDVLSSDNDDNCPSIFKNILVFASNRPGGYGAYDLWYSINDGQVWGMPVNFGKEINSEYDEFRPVIFETDKDEFFNNLMIFSSNRPEGKGGYDLYITGLDKIFN